MGEEQGSYQPSPEEISKAEEMMTPNEIEMSSRREKLLEAGQSEERKRDISLEEALDQFVGSIESGHPVTIKNMIGGNSMMWVTDKRIGRVVYQVDKQDRIDLLPQDAAIIAPLIQEELIKKGLIKE